MCLRLAIVFMFGRKVSLAADTPLLYIIMLFVLGDHVVDVGLLTESFADHTANTPPSIFQRIALW